MFVLFLTDVTASAVKRIISIPCLFICMRIHCVSKNVAVNYLHNKYNTFRHLLKTSLHYHVKQKSLKSAFALPILDDKAVNSNMKIFKHLKKHITLLTYLLPCTASRLPITSSQI